MSTTREQVQKRYLNELGAQHLVADLIEERPELKEIFEIAERKTVLWRDERFLQQVAELADFIVESAETDDQSFAPSMIEKLSSLSGAAAELLLSNQAQAGGHAPLEHIIDHFNKLVTSGISSQGRLNRTQDRLLSMLHDFGKVAISQGDDLQLHAELSYILVTQIREVILAALIRQINEDNALGSEEEPSDQQVRQLAEDVFSQLELLVRYHHLPELMAKKLLSWEETTEILSSPKLWVKLQAFAVVDAASGPGGEKLQRYLGYALENAREVQVLLSHLFETQAQALLAIDVSSLDGLIGQLANAIEKMLQYLGGEINQLAQDIQQTFWDVQLAIKNLPVIENALAQTGFGAPEPE